MRAKGIAVLLALLLLLAACSNSNNSSTTQNDNTNDSANANAAKTQEETSGENAAQLSGDDLAYEKYAEPVTINIGWKLPDNSQLAEGDTNENNPISRYFESISNIKVVHAWEAKWPDAYIQKVNLAIASDDLPDAVVVDRNQLRNLVENDQLADLTGVYNKYASSLVRTIHDSAEGKALADATFDGKLYGLPNVAIDADAPTYLWIRQDWLDKLKLSAPKTIDDIAAIAKAFMEQDPDGNEKADTIGIAGYKEVVYGEKPGANGFDGIFGAYHAFPKNWIKDQDGKVVYGSITPENKDALAKLAEWYKAGLIDKEFALRKDTQEPIVANQTGLYFGPWWGPYWPLADSVQNDPKAEWRVYAAPVDKDGKFVTHMAPVTDRYIVVRKGYEHPEAAVKLLNFFTRLERRQDPNKEEVAKLGEYAAETATQSRTYYPFDLLLEYADAIPKRHDLVQQAIKGEISVDELDPDAKQVYESTVYNNENPKKNMDFWKAATAFGYGGAISKEPMEKVYGVFYGTTKTMETKWATLKKLENETYLKIITGALPVDAFDEFVQQWKSLGGDQITKEVEQAIGG